MNEQKAVRDMQMMKWVQQIHECQQSGLSIREWCANNGVNAKTYYCHRKRVRQELLDNIESGTIRPLKELSPGAADAPVFAALPMPQRSTYAATVQIGSHIAEIHNDAEADTVESVLRALARL